MKKITVILISFILIFLLACSDNTEQHNNQNKPVENKDDSVRAVWIFYRELSMADENGGTAESFKKKIDEIFDNCVSLGLNTVFFHVRPFADSFYKSDIFPLSEYLTGEQGGKIDYDPLGIAVESAHERNISIHAWINPFRVSFSSDLSELSESNPAKKYAEEESELVYISENGIYFNPSCEENHRLIINGVREIVNNYDVDGVHIDDYFYPTSDEDIDKTQYGKYVSDGGGLSLKEWRIQCINSFVSSLYSAVKSADKNMIFSISPAGNVKNNYDSLFADVKRWGSTAGYCDWLIPQLYYSFDNKTLPYEKALKEWRSNTTLPSVKLIAGLGAYKAVSDDDEWKDKDIIKSQLKYAEKDDYDGYALFSYSSIISDKMPEF